MTRAAFDYIGTNGNGGAPHLAGQPEEFGFGEGLRFVVDCEHELISQFEGLQFFMVAHRLVSP